MFVEYNVNPADKKVGDCVIRALTKALGMTWEEVYLALCLQGYKMYDMPSSNTVWGAFLRSMRGNSYRYDDGNSMARGRTGNVRRDSMGRYSRDDALDDMVDELEELMEKAPDEQTKKEFRRFINKVQAM